MLGGQKEGKKTSAFLVEEQKGCAYSNAVREGPNGRCSKDLTSQFKPRLVGGGEREGQRGDKKT
jgi:hypothetical protein